MSDGSVTVAHCVEGLPVGQFLWEILLYAFLASFLLGSLNESTPFALGLVSSPWSPTGQNVEILFAAAAFGSSVSVLLCGWLADRYGRATVIRSSVLMVLCSFVLLQAVQTFKQAVLARVILGLASGGLTGVLMPLLAELLPSKKRGFYLSVWCCGEPVGALFAILFSCAFPGLSWSSFTLLMLMPAAILYLLMRMDTLPESPRFLYLVGQRDDGFCTLLDIYDREGLAFPWSADSIAATTAASVAVKTFSDTGKSYLKFAASSQAAITAWLCVASFFICAAAQCMKIWMPLVLAASKVQPSLLMASTLQHPAAVAGIKQRVLALLSVFIDPLSVPHPDERIALVLSQAYLLESVGIIVAAFVSMIIYRKCLIQVALVLAALFSILALFAERGEYLLLTGPVVGAQLIAQAAALIFLQVFACEKFPTSCRGTTVGLVMFSGQLARLVMPVLSGKLIQHYSSSAVNICCSCLYVLALAVSCLLPLPSTRERPLHDMEEPRGKDASARIRKRAPVSYQTL